VARDKLVGETRRYLPELALTAWCEGLHSGVWDHRPVSDLVGMLASPGERDPMRSAALSAG
jgi:hypothetical protein